MDDYISRQAAIDAIEEHIKARLDWVTDSYLERQGLNVAMCAIEDLPSADAVEVVRCKDCRYFNNTFPLLHMCNISGMKMETDDFCSYGEQKEMR